MVIAVHVCRLAVMVDHKARAQGKCPCPQGQCPSARGRCRSVCNPYFGCLAVVLHFAFIQVQLQACCKVEAASVLSHVCYSAGYTCLTGAIHCSLDQIIVKQFPNSFMAV